jgi:hypothetical protein
MDSNSRLYPSETRSTLFANFRDSTLGLYVQVTYFSE